MPVGPHGPEAIGRIAAAAAIAPAFPPEGIPGAPDVSAGRRAA